MASELEDILVLCKRLQGPYITALNLSYKPMANGEKKKLYAIYRAAWAAKKLARWIYEPGSYLSTLSLTTCPAREILGDAVQVIASCEASARPWYRSDSSRAPAAHMQKLADIVRKHIPTPSRQELEVARKETGTKDWPTGWEQWPLGRPFAVLAWERTPNAAYLYKVLSIQVCSNPERDRPEWCRRIVHSALEASRAVLDPDRIPTEIDQVFYTLTSWLSGKAPLDRHVVEEAAAAMRGPVDRPRRSEADQDTRNIHQADRKPTSRGLHGIDRDNHDGLEAEIEAEMERRVDGENFGGTLEQTVDMNNVLYGDPTPREIDYDVDYDSAVYEQDYDTITIDLPAYYEESGDLDKGLDDDAYEHEV